MNKLSIILLILILILPLTALAAEEPFGDDPLDVGAKRPFVVHERNFEIGFLNMNVGISNSFMGVSEIFKKTIVLDLDRLADGFNLNFGFELSPFYLHMKMKNGMAFGIETNVEATGALDLKGNLLTLHEATKEYSDISAAVFASITPTSSFHIQKFKIKVNPSLFWSLAYIKPPAITYTMSNDDGTVLYIDYNLDLYTAFPLNMSGGLTLTGKPGFDITMGVEYPLAKEIGLTKILPFLDFSVALDFVNVPIAGSMMHDHLQMNGRIGSDQPLDFNDIGSLFEGDGSGDGPFSIGEMASSYDKSGVLVYRPFKMLLSVPWHPLFGSKLLTITPVIGFCINSLYSEGNRGTIEAGISAKLSIANCFLATLSLSYTDRMFVNSLLLALNLRAFEFFIGADLRSTDFARSWSGGGLGVALGFKFGW